MTKPINTIYLLWGAQFDEMTATIFITELRKTGLRLKVVGLTPPPIVGTSGLALTPDLTLHQALTLINKAGSLIIPGSLQRLKRFQNDPRLTELLEQMHLKKILMLISEQDKDNLDLLPFSQEAILFYPDNEDLVDFIHNNLGLLVNRSIP